MIKNISQTEDITQSCDVPDLISSATKETHNKLPQYFLEVYS